jgi:hypothetical protein
MPPQSDSTLSFSKELPMSFVARLLRRVVALSSPAPAFLSRGVVAALLTLGAGGLAGCDDGDDGNKVVDAGPDGGGPACKMSDCAGLQMPQHTCMNGGRASYVCARGASGKCIWDQPVCPSEPNLDGGDGGPNSEVGDGAPDDDALDASVSDVPAE